MSALGERMTVLKCKSSSAMGFQGELVLESSNMITMRLGNRLVSLPKLGTVLKSQSGKVILGDDMMGRLEDRLKVSKA